MSKKTPAWHTNKSPKGMGDYYGTGHKNPVGKVAKGTVGQNPVPPRKLRKPPKTLA